MCLRFINAIINVMQDDLIQLKVNNLITLRQLLSNFVIVTVSGTIGLLFLPNTFIKFVLLVLGLFYSGLFITNLMSTTKELNTILYKRKGINELRNS